MHLPREQDDSTARNSQRAGPKTDHNRQNRSLAQVRFQKRASILGAFEIGKREGWIRVRGAKAEEIGAAQSGRGLSAWFHQNQGPSRTGISGFPRPIRKSS